MSKTTKSIRLIFLYILFFNVLYDITGLQGKITGTAYSVGYYFRTGEWKHVTQIRYLIVKMDNCIYEDILSDYKFDICQK